MILKFNIILKQKKSIYKGKAILSVYKIFVLQAVRNKLSIELKCGGLV